MRTIAVYNNKGGVGKTSVCVNLTDALHTMGYRVLAVDMDGQGNTTSTFNVETEGKCTLTDILAKGSKYTAKDAIVKTSMGDILPGDIGLYNLSDSGEIGGARLTILRMKLEQVKDEYDFCIIDTPPNIGNATIASLLCADEYILPIIGEKYAIDGIPNAFGAIANVLEVNETLRYDGILMTKMDSRKKRTDVKYWNLIRENEDLKAFSRPIRIDANISDAQENRLSMQNNFKNSPASEDYRKIAEEIVNMNE